MSGKDKWVRRFSIDETAKHKNGFTIYKITSVLFPLDSPEAVTIVSVWKRYSDIQRLHKAMKALHAGLHLRGSFPQLAKWSYFKRFDKEVIEDRANTIKNLLEFIAEHRLLFASTEFVNFLQTGYPEPERDGIGVINSIRSSLQLPLEDNPPLEYQTDDDDTSLSPTKANRTRDTDTTDGNTTTSTKDNQNAPINISDIKIFEAADVEIRQTPKNQQKTDSFESLNSLDSLNSDLYEELSRITIDKTKPLVKSKSVLPDLINFDAPSTSKFDDYHTMRKSISIDSESISLNSTVYDSSIHESESRRSNSRMSLYIRKGYPTSDVDAKSRTEDSYVFEAGYMLNLAARCEDIGDYQRAFDCYKSGIEKMLIGVQSDTDPQRRALIKEKTNKYLSYAEDIYKNHLCDAEDSLLPSLETSRSAAIHCPLPSHLLQRPYEDLSLFRFLAVLGQSLMLLLHRDEQTCYVMKVIQKVPNNLTEFDEFFLQRANETKKPILPTNVPYMVPLNCYIETTNLIFLILNYAPGEKLFDYIKNYVKSVPNTPAREVNLENVFAEPLKQKSDVENRNEKTVLVSEIVDREEISIVDRLEANREKTNNNDKVRAKNVDDLTKNDNDENKTDNLDISVNELVINSQRLLLNVDKVLSDEPKIFGKNNDNLNRNDNFKEIKVVDKEAVREERIENKDSRIPVDSPVHFRLTPVHPRALLPPSAICKWAAEILTALESLHNSGVICRDLNPSNILLGDRGQVILTYFVGYSGLDMALSALHKQARPGQVNLYVAPELYHNLYVDGEGDGGERLERAGDFWSFGAILYELVCGLPLSYYHRSVFTSHTLLLVPDGIDVEAHSILTQLLTFSPADRLGAGPSGIEEIKRHPYFKCIDWQMVYDSWCMPD